MQKGGIMAKANITLANGTVVTIDGTADEIKSLLEIYSHGPQLKGGIEGSTEKKKHRKKVPKGNGEAKIKKVKKGPKGYIAELKAEGFFKAKRTMNEVQAKLEEDGHIYPLNELSTPLRVLVKDKELGRIKEKDKWVYFNR
jgi:hypothetical protein